jgi:Tol biopolymer transport system component
MILACFAKKDHTKHIGLVYVQDGSLQLIKDLGGGQSWPKCMKFSPDGRYVVYDNAPEKDNPALDIYLISSEGGSESKLVEHPSNDYVLGWVPDGKGILFASDRTGGTLSSFFLPVTEAAPGGEPFRVIHNMGPVEPLGFTSDGTYFYGFLQRLNDIYTATLDVGTGKITEPAEKFVRTFEGFNQTPEYSPDGKYLAYVSRRFPVVKPFGLRWGGNVLCIKSLETGKERELYPDLGIFGFPVWSPDGKSIFLVHWDENDRIVLSGIDAHTGDVTLALKHENNFSHFGAHQCSPSGETLYYGLRDVETGDWKIVARDLESGTEAYLYTDKRFFSFSLSPDGQWLALTLAGSNAFRLELLSTETGEASIIHTFKKGVYLRGNPVVVWTVDGKYLLLSVRDSNVDSDSYELWRIAADGGEPVKLGLTIDNTFEGLSVHPNGRQISFSTRSKDVSEVWMMENFLPK